MSLQDWLENGWLARHAASPREVQDLLSVIERDLADSAVSGLSTDARLGIAYNAALQASVLALAASGYRVARERHHERSLDSLRLTVGADEAVVRRLQAFRRKRNISDYDRAGSASPSEASEMRAIAGRLHTQVRDWIATTHPGLLEP
jgi:hypothetical protein